MLQYLRSFLIYSISILLQKDAHQWRIVFFVAAGIYFVGNTVFIIFGRTNVQRWNDAEYSAPQVESQK